MSTKTNRYRYWNSTPSCCISRVATIMCSPTIVMKHNGKFSL